MTRKKTETTVKTEDRDWHVSASQFKSYEQCKRKWYFEKVVNLPRPPAEHFAFGTVLHGVIERWMLADDTGRGPDGKPVELYPPGWHIADADNPERAWALSPIHQDLIRNLIHNAISNGDLIRVRGREIESEMRRVLFEFEGTRVVISGFIDVIGHDCVQDHKSSKKKRSGGTYFLSKDKLAQDVQLLIYAAEVLFRAQERGEAIPTHVKLRHNQFLKDHDSPFTKHTEVIVSVEDIQRNWARCLMMAQEMFALRTIPKYIFVPPTDSACNDYGGCPFLSICSGQITPEVYTAQITRMAASARLPSVTPLPLPNVTGGEAMSSVFAPQTGAAPAGQPAVPPVAGAGAFPFPNSPPPAAKQPAFAPQPAAPVVTLPGFPLYPAAPWGVPGCAVSSCNGIGVNSAGGPCGICNPTQRQQNGIVSEMFRVGPDGNGNLCWQVLPDFAAAIQARNIPGQGSVRIPAAVVASPAAAPAPQPAAPPPATPPSAPPAAPTAPVAQPQAPPPAAPPTAQPFAFQQQAAAAAAPQPAAPPASPPPTQAQGDDEEDGKAGAGRPRKGVTLYINCMPTKGVPRPMRVEDIFKEYAQKLAEAQGAESYFQLDTWKRRDYMAQAMTSIVAALKTAHVYGTVLGANDDLEHFTRALSCHATHIVAAVSI